MLYNYDTKDAVVKCKVCQCEFINHQNKNSLIDSETKADFIINSTKQILLSKNICSGLVKVN
ncbi:MAG: hypothetical protein COT81_02650 [Candidatus Buchananbacteria bacterium CG10_big_fil_rev_8_21_14_0_10_42_9]|uniref:Uncharacterized protein n=1 Tax=Candidatus Buchananbacteria bacterium CG10_big_fil_rev_8_21_14_0_10_42_9 TaxID=1974526 RepID=A0A2H0W1I7_9BACT|nr:MAG: hypothetical protein COT81_02650 [Candidatus Buchananbacteria bacterium CG10_big_fil_rev_8_21_14_0_10_42_9]